LQLPSLLTEAEDEKIVGVISEYNTGDARINVTLRRVRLTLVVVEKQ
jgi:hypothetical protein